MPRLPLVSTVDKLEGAAWLDPAAGTVSRIVKKVLPQGSVTDALHGVPLGHPVHPLMVTVPLGAWVSAAVLDVLPGNERAAKTLVALGVLSAMPTALTGVTDFSQLDTLQQRTGVVHEASTAVATVLYAASWLARKRGNHGSGKLLGFAGLAVAGIGGFLGGHLSYRQGAGVNRNEDLPEEVPAGWHSLGPVEAFPAGRPRTAQLGSVPVMVLRREGMEGQDANDDGVSVLADTCSHLGGPLHEGHLQETRGQLCVVCPWHGSAFSVESGEVMRGPATAPQPVFRTRIRDGHLEVNLTGSED
ncbi:Rieske 2Fe-2S domain-containing protein [Arthrobacter gengyunqii]|uniref:Rieske 2Fe-2S domain-containing protein n=1 Tax=Arthrobacter gengyunqii TaxID=2886940 RepID=A0A9X1M1M8_9MICC|nr:Rieske 2Fe-2S domain-containing protein [Arthrobacter gengyunqii]MCC3266030.1 Rieske 2Fe-2S domain-containing protein [Arthrobacter gengyunqii]MCC3268744.1 Rieske 2Fe-2S domain-containing protein [Arthrobacter gengyunqii]UOY96128.1 Rieske 2Fe-2S domain-containing protein [Arthrobacter gengyunqii]